MNLAGARSVDVGKHLRRRGTVMVPVGSMEQHGEAAPLACDTIIPVRLCAEAGERTGTAYTPALTFGCSTPHSGFPGTVSLGAETLAMLARDVALSLCGGGFRRVLFLSGHGGNRAGVLSGLDMAARRLPGASLRYMAYWDLPGAVSRQRELFGGEGGYHVTVQEVSMVWWLMGEEMPEFRRLAYPPEPSPGEVLSPEAWRERYPEGGAGSDLSKVSEEKGREYFRFLVSRLEATLRSMEGEDDA